MFSGRKANEGLMVRLLEWAVAYRNRSPDCLKASHPLQQGHSFFKTGCLGLDEGGGHIKSTNEQPFRSQSGSQAIVL